MDVAIICLIALLFRFFWFVLVVVMGSYGNITRDMPDAFRPKNPLEARLRAWLRRRNVLNIKKRFVYKDENIITVQNNHVSFVIDTDKKIINCVDNGNLYHILSVMWKNQPASAFEKYDTFFDRAFDNVCYFFNEYTTFKDLSDFLKQNFVVEEINRESDKSNLAENKNKTKFMRENKTQININYADEKELSKLPGISIIIAKKIIKYRDLHGGFKSKDEFYREMKIKPHFKNQIDKAIALVFEAEKRDDSDERIIDF